MHAPFGERHPDERADRAIEPLDREVAAVGRGGLSRDVLAARGGVLHLDQPAVRPALRDHHLVLQREGAQRVAELLVLARGLAHAEGHGPRDRPPVGLGPDLGQLLALVELALRVVGADCEHRAIDAIALHGEPLQPLEVLGPRERLEPQLDAA